MLGISSCLGGIACRYDGNSNTVAELKKMMAQEQAAGICPEVLGGLPTPREPAEIIGGDGFDVWLGTAKVVSRKGEDVTENFKKGAVLAYEKLAELDIDCLVMKANSPSCGSRYIYDGTFSGNKRDGAGVAAAYFINHGLEVMTEEDWLMREETF